MSTKKLYIFESSIHGCSDSDHNIENVNLLKYRKVVYANYVHNYGSSASDHLIVLGIGG